MTDQDLDSLEDFIRKAGAELEQAYRESGTPLPPGLSGEKLAKWALEDMRRASERWAPEFKKLEQQVRTELSPGASREDYIARLSAKVQAWLRDHPEIAG